MRNFRQTPKSRCDSALESRLTSDQANELYLRLERGLTLADAARELRETHDIKLSESAICRWAAKRRRAKAQVTFARLVERVGGDREQAALLACDVCEADYLHEANVLLLSQALFEACRNEDRAGMQQISRMFAQVLGVVARNRTSRTSHATELRRQSAEEARKHLATWQADFAGVDPESEKLEKAAELRRVIMSPTVPEREKVRLTMEALYVEEKPWPMPWAKRAADKAGSAQAAAPAAQTA